jgi:hypothetical protein
MKSRAFLAKPRDNQSFASLKSFGLNMDVGEHHEGLTEFVDSPDNVI